MTTAFCMFFFLISFSTAASPLLRLIIGRKRGDVADVAPLVWKGPERSVKPLWLESLQTERSLPGSATATDATTRHSFNFTRFIFFFFMRLPGRNCRRVGNFFNVIFSSSIQIHICLFKLLSHTVGFIPIIRLLELGGYFPADLKKWLHIPRSIFSLCNEQHNKITTQITVLLLRIGGHRGKNNNERGNITKQSLDWKQRRERQQGIWWQNKRIKSYFCLFIHFFWKKLVWWEIFECEKEQRGRRGDAGDRRRSLQSVGQVGGHQIRHYSQSPEPVVGWGGGSIWLIKRARLFLYGLSSPSCLPCALDRFIAPLCATFLT